MRRVDESPRRWLLQDVVLLAIAAVAVVVFAVIFLRTPAISEWYHVYVRAALRMRELEPVNVLEERAYAYPPAMAFLTVPLSYLPVRVAALGWFAVNLAAAAAVVVGTWRLAGGPPLRGMARVWLLVFAAGMLINARFSIGSFQHQQFDMVIAGLLFVGCLALWRGHDLRAALWLGASAAMKCTPLLFAPYLVWRRKFLAAGVMLAVAGGLNLLPDVVFPQSSGRLYVQDWAEDFLGAAARERPGAWFTDPTQNQSLAGTLGRLGESALSPHALRMAIYAISLALLAITAAGCGRPFQPPEIVPANSPRPVPLWRLQVGMEAAAGVCLMLLVSPMSGKSHFIVLLLPCFLIVRMAVVEKIRAMQWLVIPLVLLGPLSTKGFWGKHLGGQALGWGLPTWYVLTMLVGIWIGLRYIRRRGETVDAPGR
jgi:hypothetical protein